MLLTSPSSHHPDAPAVGKWVLPVVLAVVALTVAGHLWRVPLLDYPLFLGILAHRAIADPSSVTDTLTKEKIGFAAEIFVNLAIYSLFTLALVTLRRKPRAHDSTSMRVLQK
jgi:hypothetical protein